MQRLQPIVRESLIMQRVHDDLMLLDVGFHRFIGHIGERIQTHSVHFRIDGNDRADSPLATVGATQASDQAVVLSFLSQQGFDLPHVAAFFLPLGSQYRIPSFEVCSSIVSVGWSV